MKALNCYPISPGGAPAHTHTPPKHLPEFKNPHNRSACKGGQSHGGRGVDSCTCREAPRLSRSQSQVSAVKFLCEKQNMLLESGQHNASRLNWTGPAAGGGDVFAQREGSQLKSKQVARCSEPLSRDWVVGFRTSQGWSRFRRDALFPYVQ